MAERPVQDRELTEQLSGRRLVLIIAVAVAVITGIFAVAVMLATDRGPEPGSELFQGEPVASGSGVDLYLAAFSDETQPIPMDPAPFDGELVAGNRISLRLVYQASDVSDEDDLIVRWIRDGEELQRDRIVLRSGRDAGLAQLEGTETDVTGTYRVQVLVEETPLTELSFEVVQNG